MKNLTAFVAVKKHCCLRDPQLGSGAKRFTDLRSGLPAISPNVLTQRLAELEDAAAILYRKTDLNAALRKGSLAYQGDKTAFKRFLKLFSLPEPAGAE
ncbi:MAG: winged helix-turn-helix transcriptional regulator [Gammaproteobacteria bacterium]